MDFIKALFSKLHNPKTDKEHVDLPIVHPEVSTANPQVEIAGGSTEKYNLIPNAESEKELNSEDNNNVNNIGTVELIHNEINTTGNEVLKDLRQKIDDDVLKDSNNISTEENNTKDNSKLVFEEVSLYLERNLDNAELNNNENIKIDIEGVKFSDNMNTVVETFDFMQNFDIKTIETKNIDSMLADNKNIAVENILLNSVKLDNVEAIKIDKEAEDTMICDQINTTIDKVLLDLDEFEIKSYKYEENDLREFMNINEPIAITDVANNSFVDFGDFDINTHYANITKVDKQELDEYDLENELDDILTIINETERKEMDNNDIAKLSDNNQDSQNNDKFSNINKPDVIQIHSPEVTKDILDDTDIISISSTEDLQINNGYDIDVDVLLSTLNSTDNYNILNITNSPRQDCRDTFTTQNTIDVDSQDKYLNVHVDDMDLNDNISECSYHSSDFEFITEKEAKKDGFIINFRRTKKDIEKPSRADSFNYSSPDQNCFLFEDSYRENHVIPEGDDFLNLFRGIYAPDVSNTYFFENKSIHASKSMNVEFKGMGFDMRILSKRIEDNISEEEHKEEADQCVNKILEMYPRENRPKRRRRY